MNKYIIVGVVGLVAWVSQPAHAQGLFSRTTPPTRPYTTDPRVALYSSAGGQGGVGLLFPVGPSPFTGGAPIPGTPVPPGAVGQQPAMVPDGNSLSGQRTGGTGPLAEMGSPLETGHPVGFGVYSQYFGGMGTPNGYGQIPGKGTQRTPPATAGAPAAPTQSGQQTPNATGQSRSRR